LIALPIYNCGMQTTLEQIKIRHAVLSPVLDEKQYRIYLASEAKALGWGGVSKVALTTNASRNTISSGLDELTKPPDCSGCSLLDKAQYP
jgi:hypothetical protein